MDIVVVGYRSEAFLPRLFDDLEGMSVLPHQVHYWDNIGNPKSLSVAWNDLSSQGRAPYLCILNPDVALSPRWDERLIRALDNPEIGTAHAECAGRSVDGPIPSRATMEALGARACGHGRVETWDVLQCGIDALRFFCVMTRRADWERLHGVDERMRFWRQDSDYHWRMRTRLGKFAAFVIGCPVWHHTGASTHAAIDRGEIDFAFECRLSDHLWDDVRSEHRKDWDFLTPGERAAVRRNPLFQRITPKNQIVRHIVKHGVRS